MADFNPLSLWHRLLGLPNESRTKTIAIAFLVSAISAVVVSGVAVTLRPLQEANLAADRQARLDAMVASLPAMAEVIRASGAESPETLIVDLRSGRATDEIAASDFDFRGFAADPKL
ncbi:MAG: NADH:ubiquinone reductase (Na(+)-transporting) subunit C, partial [Alphaproteobacteria bacterium]